MTRSQETSSSLPEGHVSIAGLDKAAVLAALYNASQPLGMGFLHATPHDMTVEQARELIATDADPDYTTPRRGLRFDYLHGRVLKVDLAGDSFGTWLYDRDNGQGAAGRVIEKLRGGK